MRMLAHSVFALVQPPPVPLATQFRYGVYCLSDKERVDKYIGKPVTDFLNVYAENWGITDFTIEVYNRGWNPSRRMVQSNYIVRQGDQIEFFKANMGKLGMAGFYS